MTAGSLVKENIRLRAEVERLKAANETLMTMNSEIAASNADHIRWHREMEAEVERLKDRIEAALKIMFDIGRTACRTQYGLHACVDRAKEALTGGPEIEMLKAEVERLKDALRHAMVCSFPEELQFRCKGCVEAERALTGGRE